jgi:gliding motility-associated-like protein
MGTDSVPIKEIDCSLTNIPNTFTPNGDGINDTWEIDALQAFPNCTVAIYTRWGQQVFKSTGYAKPFDGNYNGKELPVGTYYYVISLTNNSPPVAGFVTIIR